ncbi:MAG: hypothetical protein FWD26_03505 [Treponema sp.]|nr:hypothetical protein [Treponema sp.]
MKITEKIRFMAIIIAMAAAVVFQAAAEEKPNFIIGNLANGVITELVIKPCSEYFPENRNCVVFENLSVEEGGFFGAVLRDNIIEADIFDIDIVVDGKRYASKKGVRIDFSGGKIPVLYFSTSEAKLLDGLLDAAPMLAASGFIATTKPIIPKAAAKIVTAVLPKLGVALIPKIGWIIAGCILVVEGVIIAYNHFTASGELYTQIEYN